MRARGPLLAAIAVALTLSVAQSAPAPTKAPSKPPSSWKPAQPAKPARGRVFIDGVLDTGQFLPDTTLMLGVDSRTIRARDFVGLYFDSYAEFRPKSDSLGRVEFMNNLTNREVMALVAKKVDRPFGFEDRAEIRDVTQRALSNALMQHMVLDSVQVTEDEVRQAYDQTGYEQRFRQMMLADYPTAARVRNELTSGKTGWAVAWPKYHRGKDKTDLGDQGFISRDKLDNAIQFQLYALKPGEISLPFEDPQGWHIVQVTERRKVKQLDYEATRSLLYGQVRNIKVAVRATRLSDDLRARFGVTYDTTNIAYVASKFPVSMSSEGIAGIHFRMSVPHFAPEDTSRVLARYQGGELTLGTFMTHYRSYPPLLRPPVNSPSLFRTEVDALVLEPYRAQVALEHHLDQDPTVVAEVAKRRERIQVEHLYQDSVESRVWLTPQQRRKYYQDHLAQFVTFAQVRFAFFVSPTKAGADSLAARLKAGERPEDILKADSLAGLKRGSVRSQNENDEGLPYHAQLFEEIRPGQVVVYGPDDAGQYVIIKSLESIAGRQLSYEESERYIDESLHNEVAEKLTNDFLARHRKRYRIVTHPELVMRLRWIDPASTVADL